MCTSLLNKRWAVFSAVVLYSLLLFAASQLPFRRPSLLIQIINNALHIPAYMALFLLLYACLGSVLGKGKHILALSLSSGISACFGLLMEVFQSGISGRSCSFSDVLLNLAGIAAGIAFIGTKDRYFISNDNIQGV